MFSQVVTLAGGQLGVAWGDGTKSVVGPEDVYLVSRDDEDVRFLWNLSLRGKK